LPAKRHPSNFILKLIIFILERVRSSLATFPSHVGLPHGLGMSILWCAVSLATASAATTFIVALNS